MGHRASPSTGVCSGLGQILPPSRRVSRETLPSANLITRQRAGARGSSACFDPGLSGPALSSCPGSVFHLGPAAPSFLEDQFSGTGRLSNGREGKACPPPPLCGVPPLMWPPGLRRGPESHTKDGKCALGGDRGAMGWQRFSGWQCRTSAGFCAHCQHGGVEGLAAQSPLGLREVWESSKWKV